MFFCKMYVLNINKILNLKLRHLYIKYIVLFLYNCDVLTVIFGEFEKVPCEENLSRGILILQYKGCQYCVNRYRIYEIIEHKSISPR